MEPRVVNDGQADYIICLIIVVFYHSIIVYMEFPGFFLRVDYPNLQWQKAVFQPVICRLCFGWFI